MSVWSDIKRAMRPAEMEDFEWRGLREAVQRGLTSVGGHRPGDNVEIPAVTKAGKAYLLKLKVGTAGRIQRFEVDHDPDLSSPAFEAYVDKRVEWEREKAAKS